MSTDDLDAQLDAVRDLGRVFGTLARRRAKAMEAFREGLLAGLNADPDEIESGWNEHWQAGPLREAP